MKKGLLMPFKEFWIICEGEAKHMINATSLSKPFNILIIVCNNWIELQT